MTLLLATLACTLVAPAPELSQVLPSRGWNGEDTPVNVFGTRLLPALKLDGETGSVDATFSAWLMRDDAEVALERVSLLDVGTLDAVIPEGLEPGAWDLRVRTPTGAEDVLADAFVVTDTRADHLDLSVTTAAWTAGETARVTVRLQDPDGVRVAEPALVEVFAASPTGAGGVAFLEGGLDGQRRTDGGVGVRGRLDADGEGSVLLRSESPDDVTVRVSSLTDPEGVRGDELLLTWSAGSIADVGVELPVAGFDATAGVPFSVDIVLRDSLGNVLEDDSLDVLIYDGCGDLREGRTVRGRTALTLTLHRACERNTIHVFADGNDWTSEPFAVEAGPLSGYRVNASRSVVTAGVESLGVLVSAVDSWDNVVHGAASVVRLRDTLGGLDVTAGAGDAQCAGFPDVGPSVQLCNVRLERAGETRLVVEDDEGRNGTSTPMLVVAGPPVRVELRTDESVVAAGETFAVRVSAEDAYGNAADPSGIAWLDTSGTVACVEEGIDGVAAVYACTVTAAGLTEVEATTEAGVLGTLPLEVVNGVLAVVELSTASSDTVAGESVPFTVSAWDAWGNPWSVRDDPRVDLSADLGEPTPAFVDLGSDGTGTVDVTLTTAGAVRLLAGKSGVILGESAPVRVEAGSPSRLRVDVSGWVDVEASFDADVQATDAWDNPTDMPSGELVVAGGSCVQDAAWLVDGYGSATLTCVDPSLDLAIEAQAAGLTGRAVVDVLDLGCTDGPSASLLLDGDTEAVTCADSVVASVADTVEGAAPLNRVWIRTDASSWALAAEDGALLPVDLGIHVIRAVVVDDDACGDMATGVIWAGADDGSATGPIAVTGPAIARDGDMVTVTALGSTCAGDPAASVELGVRADVGALRAAASGDGLRLVSDASGAARVDWSLDDGRGGVARVQVGTATAWGETTVVVSGDTTPPYVVTHARPTDDALTLRFSEEMDTATVTVRVDGALASTAWNAEGTIVTVSLPEGTAWTVGVDADATDLAGNVLRGAFAGGVGPYVLQVGAVSAPGAPVGCAGDVPRFTPDGDAGAGVAAEEVTMTWGADADPAAWVWRVYDGDDVVRAGRVDGMVWTAAWDGRGDDGRIVASGTYAVEVRAVSTDGAEGDACNVYVGLRETFTGPATTR